MKSQPQLTLKHSAGGVVIRDNKVLTIFSASRNSLSLPKGGIDENESLEQAACREVKEETGYDVTITRKLANYTYEYDWTDGTRHRKTVTYYFMELSNDSLPVPSLQDGEDFEVRWLPIDDAIEEFTYDEAKDAVRRAVAYK